MTSSVTYVDKYLNTLETGRLREDGSEMFVHFVVKTADSSMC